MLLCRLGERITHYASLIAAEKPLEAHKAYMAHRRSSMVAAAQPPVDIEEGGTYEVQADATTESAPEEPYEGSGEYDDAYWEERRSLVVQRQAIPAQAYCAHHQLAAATTTCTRVACTVQP